MKIAYINTVFGVKSTGRTYAELKQSLEEKGHEVKVFYGFGKSNVANTYRIGNDFTYYTHNFCSRIFGLEGHFSYCATKKLTKQLEEFNPDIIEFGNIHGHYLHLPTIFKYLHKVQKPTFITTHDCWSFTGKCTHFTEFKCDKYQTLCKDCPAKKNYPRSWFFDFSKKLFLEKKEGFSKIENLTVICVSNWMGEQVNKSFLKEKKVEVNYNWIDTNNFNILDTNERKTIRNENGINDEDFLIIAVSSFWKKSTPRYNDLLALMGKLKDNQKLLVVGSVQDEFPANERVKFISFVSDVKYLAKLYGSADAFVHFSVEDTFGKVIAEAQATGTPAIVYNSTACPEVALIGNGYVCEKRNVNQAYSVIEQISNMSLIERDKNRIERAKLVHDVLSKETRINYLIDLYEKALNDNGKEDTQCY